MLKLPREARIEDSGDRTVLGMRSRILIVTRWFPPEQAPFGQMMNQLARDLVARGFVVDVITSVPSHPAAVVFGGWRNRLLQIELPIPGLRFLRVGAVARRGWAGQAPPGKFIRLLSFLWFAVASSVVACFVRRPRVIFAVLQPLTIGPLLWLVSRLRRARVIFSIQDLHPDVLIHLGLVRQPVIVGALRRIESFSYRRADGLAVICEGFRDHCIERGGRADRISVIPNWIDLSEIRPQAISLAIRKAAAVRSTDVVALYAGTIGMVSGANVVIEAAAKLGSEMGVHFVFVGEGQLLPRLREQTRDLGLENVSFLPFQSRESLNDVQSAADVSLVTLLPGHGRTSVPSKVLGYLAAGRPVVAAVDAESETARFLRRADAGIVVPPGDATALASAIVAMRDDPARRRAMGEAGRRYLEKICSPDKVLLAYAEMFESFAA